MRGKTWILGSILAAVLTGGGVEASSGGITGFSGATGTTCSVCHSGGTVPTVELIGPATVAPGATANYSIVITGGQEVEGGFNVATSAGTISLSDPQTRLASGEVTHTDPRAAVSGVVSFNFNWQAPALPGTVTMYGAGNSVNGDNTNSFDAAAATQLQISVENVAAGTPGEPSAPGLQPLRVTSYDSLTGDLSISYEAGCDTDDNNVYYGPLDQVGSYNWTDEICSIGNLGSATINPSGGSIFFVVVGNKNGDEGSYGRDSSGVERSTILLNVCGESQDLSNTCIP